MDVENIAVLDTIFDSESFSKILRNEKLEIADNLLQIVAIGAICNAASFDNSSALDDKSICDLISGNATGNALPFHSVYISLPIWTDAAILRFSDSIASAETTRQRWTSVYHAHFSSNVFYSYHILILYSC